MREPFKAPQNVLRTTAEALCRLKIVGSDVSNRGEELSASRWRKPNAHQLFSGQ